MNEVTHFEGEIVIEEGPADFTIEYETADGFPRNSVEAASFAVGPAKDTFEFQSTMEIGQLEIQFLLSPDIQARNPIAIMNGPGGTRTLEPPEWDSNEWRLDLQRVGNTSKVNFLWELVAPAEKAGPTASSVLGVSVAEP